MGLSYFFTILKQSEKAPQPKKVILPTIQPLPEPSPRTKERMRKVKSEEDFMKVQVPWIL